MPERVDALGVGDGLDRPENALGFLDTRAVVRLDASEIEIHQLHGGELLVENGGLDVRDAGFFDAEGRPGVRGGGSQGSDEKCRAEENARQPPDPHGSPPNIHRHHDHDPLLSKAFDRR